MQKQTIPVLRQLTISKKIEGNDIAVIENDTAISNPNNTILDATGVNIEEN